MAHSPSPDVFLIESHGDVTVVAATPALELLDPTMEQHLVDAIMGPLRRRDEPLVVFDLSDVDYFGSMFLAVLLRCWKLATAKGGTMVLAGVSDRARELLRLTSLDMIWPMYASRAEAIEALLSD